MMRLLLDTNAVVSGLFWHGPAREILDAARQGRVRLITSAALLLELHDVLLRPKMRERLAAAGVVADDLVVGYAALATVVEAPQIPPVVLDDPDDDLVLACALAGGAEVLVSGDRHLLALGTHRGVQIVSPAIAAAQVRA